MKVLPSSLVENIQKSNTFIWKMNCALGIKKKKTWSPSALLWFILCPDLKSAVGSDGSLWLQSFCYPVSQQLISHASSNTWMTSVPAITPVEFEVRATAVRTEYIFPFYFCLPSTEVPGSSSNDLLPPKLRRIAMGDHKREIWSSWLGTHVYVRWTWEGSEFNNLRLLSTASDILLRKNKTPGNCIIKTRRRARCPLPWRYGRIL